jgi:uncharacterized repeat protein (TIGR01451 family)
MKQVEHKILSMVMVIAALAVLFLSFKPILARGESYSNDNRKELSIDKQLRSVSDSKYVDNIASSTRVFYQNDLIEFKIRVENTGTGVLKNIKVTDNLPPFLTLIFFPGTYDKTNNKVDWTIDQLNAGDSQEFLIRAKIDNAKEVKTLTKETNVSTVRVDELGDKDDASYFIAAGGGVSIPNTGDPSLLIKTGIVVTLGLTGFALRKKIRGY